MVLATGLGKTWLAAFDSRTAGVPRASCSSPTAKRSSTRPRAPSAASAPSPLGLYTRPATRPHADVVFASVQTLSRPAHLEHFARDAFDYIVVDEFHHAAADTYRRLIAHFSPDSCWG